MSEPDIRGVIYSAENVIQDKLAQGRIVRLEKLGSLYPAISSLGELVEKDVTASSIKKVKANYRPGKRILAALREAGFNKIKA